ncbi:MAG: glycosyltransferase family A protein [Lyngbya sp.]|nr:glycosyltransferase family A protein [Lyngbya sp.]
MENSVVLSVITPTRGNFSEFWLQQLFNIQGSVEFILVYPPQETPKVIEDPRLKIISSPYKGEVIQRGTGLVNATGQYIIALDDDDYLHPNTVDLLLDYFHHYPESWCLRLKKNKFYYDDEVNIKRDWDTLPQIKSMTVVSKCRDEHDKNKILQELPIAPLDNHFKLISLWFNTHRTDHHGAHIENFNNIIWKSSLVKSAITDLFQGTQFYGPLTWMPFWSLDRLLGLYIQAKFFRDSLIVGHWLRGDSEQVRYITRPSSMKEVRTMFPADMLLALRFPKYGYFWNLFFDEFWIAVKTTLRTQVRKK